MEGSIKKLIVVPQSTIQNPQWVVTMESSIKNLIVLLDENPQGESYLHEISRFFPLLDVTSDIYVISEKPIEDTEKIKSIISLVLSFLQQYSFYRITVHPVHPFSSPPSLKKTYTDLLKATHPFNQEAYLHQSISRLMILPVIKVGRESEVQEATSLFEFLRERNMVPCLYLPGGRFLTFLPKLVKTERERIYLEIGEGSTPEKVIHTLCAHMELDDLLHWANSPVKTDLPRCRTLIFAECDGKVYAHKLGCSIEIVHQLKETLKINHREKELATILFHLGLERIKKEDYRAALELFDEVLTLQRLCHKSVHGSTSSPRTDYNTLKINCLSVRPEPVEGRGVNYDTVSQEGRDTQGTVFLFKALCLLKLREIGLAQAALDEAEKRHASLAMIYYYRGLCEFELKDYIEAIDLLAKALEVGPDQVPKGDAYFYMSLSHINILEYNEGLSMLREAEKVYPHDQISPVYYYMGVCHFGKNDVDTADQFFRKALAANPKEEDLSSIYLYLGICHKEKGDFIRAIEELRKAKEAEEDRLEVHNLMGFCYFKLKDYDKAIKSFLRAVEINPHSAIDWANLGVNVRAKGEEDKAILLLKKALSLDPTIGFARKHLEELLKKKAS